MDRIGLKINNIWCILPADISINIEEQSPVFSDSGAFSYPIELNVSDNRELFKNIDSIDGLIRTTDLDGLPFELYFDGVLILYGITEMDDDTDVEDTVSVNLVSGNGDFQSKIDGMQATDVPLMNKIFLGYSYPYAHITFKDGKSVEIFLDEDALMEYTNVNVSDPYPIKPYCNVRTCVTNPTNRDENPYIEYEADRPWSGVCFYVSYFLDCLFKYLNYTVTENNLPNIEDMNRLAFFTTKCEFEYGSETKVNKIYSNKEYLKDTEIWVHKNMGNPKISITKKEIYATNANFPNVDVSSIINSLFSAFGIKIIANTNENTIKIVYIRDILKDNEMVNLTENVFNKKITYSKLDAVSIAYSGNDNDTSFNYSDYTKTKIITDYLDLIKNISALDKTCYIDKYTGNKYRIKIDSKAEGDGDEENYNPSLFEVGQFNSFVLGENQTTEKEEITIDFNPVIGNDINFKKEITASIKEQRMAVYIDAEMKEPEKKTIIIYPPNRNIIQAAIIGGIVLKYYKYINYNMEFNTESPLRSFDSGFTLGIMRGAGSNSKIDIFKENYDGNGNDAWITVASDYAFTSDTMDAYGNRYDYNGTEPGGAGEEGRISLKLHIETKPEWGIDETAAKRGLADKYMSEYLYFLKNRKTVSMDIDMTLSRIINLDWTKKHSVGGTIGYLKSKKYTLTNKGVSNQSIELYTLN